MEIALAFNRHLLHDPRVLEIWRNEFETIEYADRSDLQRRVQAFGADFLYQRKYGYVDDLFVEGPRLLVHVVFQVYQPHGHAYAYISSWLAEAVKKDLLLRLKFEANPGMPGSTLSRVVPLRPHHPFPVPENSRSFDFVPLITQAYTPQDDLRARLGIPPDAFVLGSLSGSKQFDIPFVRQWIPTFLEMNNSNFFLGPNLEPFIDHPRAIFLPTIIGGQNKSDYLQAINAMIHARLTGESFGNAVCEALMAGKPVLSWLGGRDRNHVALLENSGWLYRNTDDLTRLVSRLSSVETGLEAEAKALVQEFRPKPVAAQFRAVFGV